MLISSNPIREIVEIHPEEAEEDEDDDDDKVDSEGIKECETVFTRFGDNTFVFVNHSQKIVNFSINSSLSASNLAWSPISDIFFILPFLSLSRSRTCVCVCV